jgi:hypothetical protein
LLWASSETPDIVKVLTLVAVRDIGVAQVPA